MHRRGFTLVELAIVLVIIGLLVGGVLVGRDLIKAATVKNFTSTIERFTAGAVTFQVKYKALPGDLRVTEAVLYGFATRTGQPGQGDGSGVIEGCALLSQRLGCETALFWRDLWEGHGSNFTPNGPTNAPVDGSVGGFGIQNYLPETPFRDRTQIYMVPINSRNSFYVSRVTNVASDGTLTTGPALTPQEARDVDDKMDDGAPDNGIVRAMTSFNVPDAGGVPSTTMCVNNTLPKLAYNLLDSFSSQITCQIAIRSSL